MNYLDELLLLYPNGDSATKKFVLGRLLDSNPGRATDEVVELLWTEIGHSEVVIRREARYVIGRFLPRHTASAYRLPLPSLLGAALPRSSTKAEIETALAEAEISELVQAASHLLRQVLQKVYALARKGSPVVRSAASLVLGRLWTHRSLEALAGKISKGDQVNFGAAFALSEIGHRRARDAIVKAARKHGLDNPDLFMLLRSVPTEDSLKCLKENGEKTSNSYVRASIAHALAGFAPESCRKLVDKIVRGGGWPAAYALDAVTSWGSPSYFRLVKDTYEKVSERFIRAQAVRAAGAMASDEARAFCFERLSDADPTVAVAALDGLIQNSQDLPGLVAAMVPLIDTGQTRLRIQAILMTAILDPERVEGALQGMVTSDSTFERRGAAYILGHLHGLGIEDLLSNMAEQDPVVAVRQQAIQSLAQLGAARGAGPLLGLLGKTQDVTTLKDVLTALTLFPEADAGGVLTELEQIAPKLTGAATRALMLRCLGVLAGLAKRRAPERLLAGLADLEPGIVAGALEGIRRMGDGVPLEAIEPLLEHSEGKIRARAIGASFAAGDFAPVEPLVRMLESDQEPIQMSALNMFLDFACLLPFALRSTRFARMCDTLKSHRWSQEFQEFQADATPVTAAYLDIQRLVAASCHEDAVERSIQSASIRAQPIKDLAKIVAAYRKEVQSKIPGRSPVTGAATWRAAIRTAFAWPLVLMWVPFAVIGFFMVMALTAPEPAEVGIVAGPSDLERGAFSAVELTGVPTRTAGGRSQVLRNATVVRPGDLVETDARAGLLLADSTGNSIRLGPSSRVLFSSAKPVSWSPTEVRYAFDNPSGDVQFDFRRTSETKISLGPSLFTLTRGIVRVTEETAGRKFTQVAGDGTLFVASGTLHRLSSGKSASVSDLEAPRSGR